MSFKDSSRALLIIAATGSSCSIYIDRSDGSSSNNSSSTADGEASCDTRTGNACDITRLECLADGVACPLLVVVTTPFMNVCVFVRSSCTGDSFFRPPGGTNNPFRFVGQAVPAWKPQHTGQPMAGGTCIAMVVAGPRHVPWLQKCLMRALTLGPHLCL
ncbi:hypothetical protein COO60DRAFT_988611 [Scenedesmus sp. NREL 46B-D3]|nr:hypothetical protein COO60DRAFT_988611 [Scenedesmus sp. NREL 46B-D3]